MLKMIYIICGEYNQGKTAKIKSIYLEQKEGDGFITQKIFRNSIFCGYEIVRLSTGETVTQSLKTELFPWIRNHYLHMGHSASAIMASVLPIQ